MPHGRGPHPPEDTPADPTETDPAATVPVGADPTAADPTATDPAGAVPEGDATAEVPIFGSAWSAPTASVSCIVSVPLVSCSVPRTYVQVGPDARKPDSQLSCCISAGSQAIIVEPILEAVSTSPATV